MFVEEPPVHIDAMIQSSSEPEPLGTSVPVTELIGSLVVVFRKPVSRSGSRPGPIQHVSNKRFRFLREIFGFVAQIVT